MSKAMWEFFHKNPGTILTPSYFLLFASSSAVILLANMLFPNNVVVGTMSLSTGWAVAVSMGALSVFLTLAIPFASVLEKWKGRELSPRDWLFDYFLLNTILIWLLSRASDVFGLGISSWYVAAGLGMGLSLAQGLVMMLLEKLRTR